MSFEAPTSATHQRFEVIHRGTPAWLFALALAGVVCLAGFWMESVWLSTIAVTLVALGRIAAQTKVRLFGRTDWVAVGVDGLRSGKRFIPWGSIREITHSDEIVTIRSNGRRLRLRLRNPFAFVQYALGQRAEFEETTPAEPEPALAPCEGETEDERVERVADAARRSAYREGALQPEKLRALSTDPTSSPEERLVAARVLVRVAPDLVPPVRAALGAMVDTDFRDRMRAVLDE